LERATRIVQLGNDSGSLYLQQLRTCLRKTLAQLYQAALEHEASQRGTFLDRAYAGDTELRKEKLAAL